MEQNQLRAFEARCTQEEPPACQTMCPLHVDVRAITACMAEEKVAEARKILDRFMPLSGILGYLCEGSCMGHCRRVNLDAPVNMPLLERACVTLSRSIKPLPLPGSGKSVAIIGAGFSSLVAAFELAKKGHSVTVFHKGLPGGKLLSLPDAILPGQALPEALEMLAALRVFFVDTLSFSPTWLDTLLEKFPVAYIGLDDEALTACVATLAHNEQGSPVLDPVTLATSRQCAFAGGLPVNGAVSWICAAAEGKRAAISIDRVLKGALASSARDKEAPYPSTLYTDISAVPVCPAQKPAVPLAPALAEAAMEARRCVQCECLECVKHCPYLAQYKGYPKRYARTFYNNLSIVHGQRKANTQINACAECGLCAASCPFDVDMGAFCAQARKDMVLAHRMPPSLHEFALQDMEFSNSAEVAFFRHQPGKKSSAWAFFPGCQLPASLPMQTEEAYAHLTRHMQGGVGLFFACCGAPARWSGRSTLSSLTASALREQWEASGKPALILACPSCMAFFHTELPEIPVHALWILFAELPLPEKAVTASQMLALHDSCPARHDSPQRTSVRKLVSALGQKTEELPLGNEMTRCCGYGGLASHAAPATGALYAQSRANDTRNTLLSYCIMCRDRFRAVGKSSLHLLDLLFPRENIETAANRPAPGISSRQENRLAFRRNLLHKLWNETPPPLPMNTSILNISDAVMQKMEMRRILRSDVKEVLLHVEQQGSQFFNPNDGHSLASLRPRQVTFWVEFSREPDGSYTIHDAYCHRMVAPGTAGEGAPSPCTLEGYAVKGGRM